MTEQRRTYGCIVLLAYALGIGVGFAITVLLTAILQHGGG